MNKICLASDNCTSVHPKILEAIIEANHGYSSPYGSDPWSAEAEKLILESMKREGKVFFIPSGTGSNVLALKLACRRHESVICTDIAHMHSQESGAAESVVGCKILTIPHVLGKATPENILKKLKSERAIGKHATSPSVLSITQPTEIGTVYTLDEIKALSDLCQQEKLLFHMDGSRLYNAAARLNVTLDQLAQSLDLLSLGGTKNGLMCAEALVIFNPDLQTGSDHIHKQTLQLVSKMRYIAVQFIPYFKEGLWLKLAHHANQKAQEIAALIKKPLVLNYPVESNQIFFTAPSALIPGLLEKVYCYPWDQKDEIRFIASWNTSEEDIGKLKLALRN